MRSIDVEDSAKINVSSSNYRLVVTSTMHQVRNVIVDRSLGGSKLSNKCVCTPVALCG